MDILCTEPDVSRECQQYVEVSLPVQVKPSAAVGKIGIRCCDEPTVISQTNKGMNTCEITISQTLCLEIPITYKATAFVDRSRIDCKCK